ncbi:endo-beta-N-acetylglucosaminidase [Streptomyces sp. NA04227]|uniref:endo-beta-N-acetylglucosaminidase n=1 Tax=Streptomyces sp. NA04227 TaxID=2742136 RepID=UPI0020CA7D11|nr:endo-beta-N-acetylglucosaminidase [Streptomyces sp. NA04227]
MSDTSHHPTRRTSHQPTRHTPPSRRTVLLGASAAAALLGTPFAQAATSRGATGKPAADNLQPYASYWYPDSLPSGTPGDGITWRSLRKWSPDKDPDLAFNTASVPLAERFTPVPVNTSARTDQARVSALVSFGPTAANPSQGGPTADFYAPTHWAYWDELVFWGGSSGEGLILAPNAPVVDAAHRNGVPVLGTVFLPPTAFDGRIEWTRDLVQRDAHGDFPLAAKLVQVATTYGFDGWFLNVETEGGDSELATRMRDFLRALRTLGEAEGLRITWYDAMDKSGAISWQNALNEHNQQFFHGADGKVADTVFLNFRWNLGLLSGSADLAAKLGRSPYELWAGIDVESNGWDTRVDWDALFPADRPHTTSYGFYRPEWTLHHLPKERTPGQFHAADDRFWTGESLDPAEPGGSWRAAAAVVADRSTVTALPFATTFNTGHGLRWYENGEVGSEAAWNHLGLQDVLPGRRWVVRTEGERPAVTLDFAAAWRGGSSLLVDGALRSTTVELHATRLPLGPATTVELTHRADAGEVTVELGVALRPPQEPGAPLAYSFLPVQTVTRGDWSTATVKLSSLGTGTVHGLAVRLTGKEAKVSWRLGALAVRDGAPEMPAPRALRVTRSGTDGRFRFAWDPAGDGVRHYELHRLLSDGTRRFLGGTAQSAYYVKGATRDGNEPAARFELRAVGELYSASSPVTVEHPW